MRENEKEPIEIEGKAIVRDMDAKKRGKKGKVDDVLERKQRKAVKRQAMLDLEDELDDQINQYRNKYDA